MKNLKSAFLLLCMTVLVLTACSKKDDVTKAEATNDSNGTSEKIEIKYWYAFGDKIGENNVKLVEQFNASQDKIHVTAEFQGNYEDLHSKTQAAFAAKSAPEVTLNEIASVQIFAEAGLTEDLTPLIEKDTAINMDDFVPGLMGNSYVDGKVYGLPYLRSTPILYINTTLAKELGLSEEGPKTWDEFTEYLKVFTKKGERVGMTLPINIWFYEAFIAQAGGSMFNEDGTAVAFNSQEGIDALNVWRESIAEGTIKVPTSDTSGEDAVQDFVNGRSGMLFTSTANLSHLLQISEENGFELQTKFFPEGKFAKVPTGGSNLVMTSGLSEEKKAAAWEFIKFMTAKEQTIFASSYTGYLPSRKSAVDSEKMAKLYEEKPQFKVAVDQLQNGIARPMVEQYPEISKVLSEEIVRGVLDPSITTEDILKTAEEKANALLK